MHRKSTPTAKAFSEAYWTKWIQKCTGSPHPEPKHSRMFAEQNTTEIIVYSQTDVCCMESLEVNNSRAEGPWTRNSQEVHTQSQSILECLLNKNCRNYKIKGRTLTFHCFVYSQTQCFVYSQTDVCWVEGLEVNKSRADGPWSRNAQEVNTQCQSILGCLLHKMHRT
jgi:hypothetical protein